MKEKDRLFAYCTGRFWPSSNFGVVLTSREKEASDRGEDRMKKEKIQRAFTPGVYTRYSVARIKTEGEQRKGKGGYEKELRWLSKARPGFEGSASF